MNARDPRGPERTIVRIDVVMSCGHTQPVRLPYLYRIGDRAHCCACGRPDEAPSAEAWETLAEALKPTTYEELIATTDDLASGRGRR